jgi:hypothetical protein
MTTDATTFADLIKRHGAELAFISACDDSAPVEPTTLNDSDFVGLVGDAKNVLEKFRMEDWAEGLDSALTYLADALEAEDPTAKALLLGRADKHLGDTYDIASELACTIGINFPA